VLFDNKDRLKHPSASVKPANQLSLNVGSKVSIIGFTVLSFIRKANALYAERNIKNFEFRVKNTMLPLNILQINSKFGIS
jgi:hypothetical protein